MQNPSNDSIGTLKNPYIPKRKKTQVLHAILCETFIRYACFLIFKCFPNNGHMQRARFRQLQKYFDLSDSSLFSTVCNLTCFYQNFYHRTFFENLEVNLCRNDSLLCSLITHVQSLTLVRARYEIVKAEHIQHILL